MNKKKRKSTRVAHTEYSTTKHLSEDVMDNTLINALPTLVSAMMMGVVLRASKEKEKEMPNQLLQNPNIKCSKCKLESKCIKFPPKQRTDCNNFIDKEFYTSKFVPQAKPNYPLVSQTWTELNKKREPFVSGLFDDFKKNNFIGFGIFQTLTTEYEQIVSILNLNHVDENTEIVDTNKIYNLITSVYKQGVSLLLGAYQLAIQVKGTDLETIHKEIEELETELSKTKPDSTLYKLIQERLVKNKEIFGKIKNYRDKIDTKLCEAKLCIDSIREIRLQLPELVSHKPSSEFDKILLELNTRIEFAQRVHDEYEKQGI